MEIQGLIDVVTVFFHDNPIVAAVIGLVLLFLMIRKTKLFLGLVLLGLLLFAVFLMIKSIGGEGGAAKTRMIDKGTAQDIK